VSISYFILSTSLGSTTTQRKIIKSSCPQKYAHLEITMALYKVIEEEK
jgi:hypothetical protein